MPDFLSMSFFISNINFEKALLGFFLIDRMCHIIESPNLTQKVLRSIKGLVIDLSILFF